MLPVVPAPFNVYVPPTAVTCPPVCIGETPTVRDPLAVVPLYEPLASYWPFCIDVDVEYVGEPSTVETYNLTFVVPG